MKTLAGTPYFMAPEVLDCNYTSKCDIWSLGCILYMIVCGCLPFEGKSRNEVFAKIRAGDYDLKVKGKNLSEGCKELINKMLTVDQNKRPDAADLLNHLWIKEASEIQIDYKVLNVLKKFKGQSELKKAALSIFVKMIHPAELEPLRK